MSTKQDIELHESEDWKITFAAHYADGSTMPLSSGANVQFRISDQDGNEMLTQEVGSGVEITDESGGIAEIVVTAAEQYSAQILATGSYFYEIRVTKDDEFFPQAEGRLKVARSLFATPVDPLLSEFRARFPEFTEDDGIISLYIRDAKTVIDRSAFWSDDDKPVATVHLAAHFLMMRVNARIAYEGAGTGTGEVRVIRVEDRMVGFDTSRAAQGSKAGFNATPYGQYYLMMMRHYPQWMERA
jgi:hypothetical protein